MKLLAKGKVKEVYEVNEALLHFTFTDNISVFDKIIPSTIPHKGETLCRTSAYWFKKAKELGIETHFVNQPSANTMTVKRVDVIRDYAQITQETTNYLIPLEFICRHYVAGSLHDRIKAGAIDIETLGFNSDHTIIYGEQLPKPFFEVTTKLEEVDRPISREEGCKMAGLSDQDFDDVYRAVLKIDEIIGNNARERGLIHVDGKKEFAFDEQRKLMLIDTFGTADEDRFWDADKYRNNEFVENSKEFVRQYYRKTGYKDILDAARKNNLVEPPIPGLPENLIQETSALYISLFEKLTGEAFR